MARHGRKPNWNKFRSGVIQIDLAMTTLAAKTLVSQGTDTVVDTARISSIEAVYGMTDFTKTAGTGPFLFGVAHSDYTNGEIESYIENLASWDLGDKVAQEVRSRRVKHIGQIGGITAVAGNATFNDGRPKKTKLNWTVAEGDGLDFWIYNMGEQAVATTVPQFVVFGDANIWYD